MRRKSVTSEMMKGYIVESLFQLLEKKCFTEITIGEITERAGVNRSTYYRHFYDKTEIVTYFLNQVMEKMRKTLNQGAELESYLYAMFVYLKTYRREFLLLYDNGLDVLCLDTLNHQLGTFQPGENFTIDRYQLAYHVGGISNFWHLWFSRHMEDDPAEMARLSAAIFPPDFKPLLWNKPKS